MKISKTSFLTWFSILSVINAAEILFIFPFLSRSHLVFHTAIARSLQTAGHQITVVHSFTQEAAKENFTFIDASRPNKPIEFNHLPLNEALQATNSMKMLIWAAEEGEADCYQTIQTKEIQQMIQSKKTKFDVFIVDFVGPMYECFQRLAETMQIPIIGAVGARSWRKNDLTMGNPYNYATVPMELIPVPRHMSFLQRLQNTWICIVDSLLDIFVVNPKLEAIRQKYFPTLPSAPRVKPSLLFVNTHQIFVPRPLVPNVIHIGGISLPPKKPLSKNLQQFMDEAKNGVILFTFGSMLKMFPKNSKEFVIFKTVFSRMPQRVIWKSEEEIEDLPDNIMVSKWLPQRDILAHKSLVAFISHCGLSGIYEAVLEGKPIIMLPVFFDQMSNAAILADLGVGLILDVRKITGSNVAHALNSVVNDSKYQNQVQIISKIIKNAPMTPQQSVVYWTEYIIRHKGAEYLRTSEADMPLSENLLLDVLLFLFSLSLILFLLIFYTLRKFFFVVRDYWVTRRYISQ